MMVSLVKGLAASLYAVVHSVPYQYHTHTHLTALCPGLPRVSRYQKGKTNLDFTEARDSEWQWHQLGHTVFYRPDALLAAQPTASKH